MKHIFHGTLRGSKRPTQRPVLRLLAELAESHEDLLSRGAGDSTSALYFASVLVAALSSLVGGERLGFKAPTTLSTGFLCVPGLVEGGAGARHLVLDAGHAVCEDDGPELVPRSPGLEAE